MTIAVIVPTYNSSRTVCHVLNSIFSQSVVPDEVIVVDDCSTDHTVSLIKKYKGVRIHVLEKNFGGPARPRNVGLKLAASSLIAFCDSDDVWHKDKLKIQLEAIKFTGSKFISTNRKIVSNLNDFDTNSSLKEVKYEVISPKSFVFRNPIVNSSVLISKELFNNAGFLENKDLVAVEDYELYRRFSKEENIIKINLDLVGYLKTETSISGNKIKMIKKHYCLNRCQYSILKSIFRTFISIIFRITGNKA